MNFNREFEIAVSVQQNLPVKIRDYRIYLLSSGCGADKIALCFFLTSVTFSFISRMFC